MAFRRLHLLPIAVFAWFPVTFLTTYLVASLLGHVPFFLPYISDTGTFAPESCIFGQLVNLGLVQMVLVMYVRYRQIRRLHQSQDLPGAVHALNRASLAVGLLAASGIDVVANFQVRSAFVVHFLGAVAGFGLAVAYLALQTAISFRLYPMTGERWLLLARAALAALAAAAFLLCVAFGVAAYLQFSGRDLQRWAPRDGGWAFHLVSAAAEWAVALAIVSYVLTFAPEFRHLTLSEPELGLKDSSALRPA